MVEDHSTNQEVNLTSLKFHLTTWDGLTVEAKEALVAQSSLLQSYGHNIPSNSNVQQLIDLLKVDSTTLSQIAEYFRIHSLSEGGDPDTLNTIDSEFFTNIGGHERLHYLMLVRIVNFLYVSFIKAT